MRWKELRGGYCGFGGVVFGVLRYVAVELAYSSRKVSNCMRKPWYVSINFWESSWNLFYPNFLKDFHEDS
ncbi:MAG: hypothetical protein QXK32_11605 [Candidatus Jordarchaeales archaeon]